MTLGNRARDRAIPLILVVLSLSSYARLYIVQDVYADDNCWLLGMYMGNDLPGFLATGFLEMRREALGVFLYVFFLPFRLMENPHPLWNTTCLALQIASPLVLYQLVRNLSNDAWLAGFVAAAMIIFPLDHVVPYLSAINYRLGLLLGLISLLLTDNAARDGKWGWRLPLAMVLAVIAEYALMEAALGFEATRLLILWNRLGRPLRSWSSLAAVGARWWGPFAALALPLVIYKFFFKPYGIYESTYQRGFSYFFDRAVLEEAYRLLALGLWRIIRILHAHAHVATWALAIVVGFLAFLLLMRMRRTQANAASPNSSWLLLLFAVSILLPQLFIFLFAGRPPKLGTESTHAALMQPGYAVLVGGIAYLAYRWAVKHGRVLAFAASAALALFAGLGVYFNNLNLDLFIEASRRQSLFWQAFKERFPTLPPRADFVIDAVPSRYHRKFESFYELEDLHSSYELEFAINRLYSAGGSTGTRNYRVYPRDELMRDYRDSGAGLFSEERRIDRTTHYGFESLNAGNMTVVHYRDGRILVNREILQDYPNVVYRRWANKDVPDWVAKRP